ncbi:MAG TPA: hypothetical protein VLD67_05490 [Vicinamibacterales bacterium]|nr:hypothetical protein [Vicinamibacterales bacterium]
MRTSRFAVAAAALAAALSAWLSQSTIAVAAPDGPRIALLPISAFTVLLAASAGAIVVLLSRAAPLTPVWLLGLTVLPWLPVDVPAPWLIWSGPLTLIVWLAVFWIMARRAPLRITILFAASAPLRAGLLALLLFSVAAWRAAPAVPGGDEPHYLVITQSLLYDGDLRIENNHRRGDYQAYFAGQLRPDYLRRGRDGEIYSIHAPGVSALVLPAFALGGYRGVVVFLLLVAAAASALLWHVVWLAARSRPAAWFGWAAVTLSATTVFHSFTVYPDGLGGVLVLTGIWALLRTEEERVTVSTSVWPWGLHGAALALLPWLHSRFALLAGSLGALVLLRLGRAPNPAAKAAAFLVVPAISALGWVGYFVAIYGSPDPSAPYGAARMGSLASIPGGLGGLLFDQRFGLLANAPVLLFGIAGLIAMLRRASGMRRLAIELLFVIVPYLLTVTNFTMWWGGWSAPARFAAPILPALAVSSAGAWLVLRDRATRTLAIGALGLTAFITVVLVVPEHGRLAFNTRLAPALWLDWLSPLASLAQGAPDWFRGSRHDYVTDVAIWGAFMAAAWLGLRWLAAGPRLGNPASFATAAVAACALCAMLALATVWARYGAAGAVSTAAQMSCLRVLAADGEVIALRLTPPGVLDRAQVPSMMRITGTPRAVGERGAGRDDRPLLVIPAMPAGRYRIRPRARGEGGWLMIGIAQDQFSVRTERIASPPEPIIVDFPVDVRALIVRGDERARQVVRRIDVEPLSLVAANRRLTPGFARRAARYGAHTVFFLDDDSYPEPEAFWVGGSRDSSIVVQPDSPDGAIDLFLRNAPVTNRIVIESGPWREQLDLAPGETRRMSIRWDRTRGAAPLRFEVEAGFRPSEVEPDSADERYLGVWVQIR